MVLTRASSGPVPADRTRRVVARITAQGSTQPTNPQSGNAAGTTRARPVTRAASAVSVPASRAGASTRSRTAAAATTATRNGGGAPPRRAAAARTAPNVPAAAPAPMPPPSAPALILRTPVSSAPPPAARARRVSPSSSAGSTSNRDLLMRPPPPPPTFAALTPATPTRSPMSSPASRAALDDSGAFLRAEGPLGSFMRVGAQPGTPSRRAATPPRSANAPASPGSAGPLSPLGHRERRAARVAARRAVSVQPDADEEGVRAATLAAIAAGSFVGERSAAGMRVGQEASGAGIGARAGGGEGHSVERAHTEEYVPAVKKKKGKGAAKKKDDAAPEAASPSKNDDQAGPSRGTKRGRESDAVPVQQPTHAYGVDGAVDAVLAARPRETPKEHRAAVKEYLRKLDLLSGSDAWSPARAHVISGRPCISRNLC